MIGIENIIKKYKFNIFKNIYFKLDIDLDLAIEFSPNYYRQRKKNKKKCNKELIFVNLKTIFYIPYCLLIDFFSF